MHYDICNGQVGLKMVKHDILILLTQPFPHKEHHVSHDDEKAVHYKIHVMIIMCKWNLQFKRVYGEALKKNEQIPCMYMYNKNNNNNKKPRRT